VRDAIQRRLQLQRLRSGRPGYDLELTLSARLQSACEAVLTEVLQTTGARSASAVVLDPNSGNILALGSVPSFDPASPGRDPSPWRLRPVQDAYEPGSTIKPFVIAASLAASTVAPGQLFDCRKRGIQVAGRWVRDHAPAGIYTLDEVLIESSNTGAITLAERSTRTPCGAP